MSTYNMIRIHPDMSSAYSYNLSEMGQGYLKALQALKAKGGNFVDSDFPPNQASIQGIGEKQGRLSINEIEWKRPIEFYRKSTDYDVFLDNLDANDLRQGSMGDCWLISCIVSIARNTYRV